MLALRVLGDFQVLLDGREVPGLTAQPSRAALLVYLAMEGSTTRDAVVALLWPEHDPQKARHALSQTLHRLRGVLGEAWLETEGERLAIGAEVQLDARSFETRVAAGEHESALPLYRGAFLAGWFLADSPGFELWADQQRARLERLHRRACREWIRERLERGDLPAALRAAQDWAEIDPLEDEAQHRLVELLAESGRRAEALRQFDLYRRLLEAEDLTPLDETVELVARLRQATDLGPGNGADPGLRVNGGAGNGHAAAAAAATPEPADRSVPPPAGDHDAGSAPSAPPPADPGRARGPRRFLRLPRGRAPRIVLVVLAPALLAGAILVGRQYTPDARARRAALPPDGRVLLADFGNDTRDSLISGAVTEALRIDLERHLHAALADPAEIARILGQMQRAPVSDLTTETAREVAMRAGIPAVIDGKVGAVGPGFVLSAWIIAAESGRILDAALATAHDSTELIAAIETLSLQLRDRIRPSLASAPKSTPLAQVTTSSLDALRKYTLAMRIWSRESDATRTLRLLEEATALDSSFAMAYRARAVVLMYTGDNERGRIQALGDAYRHRDRLSEQERYLTIATYHQSATGDIGEAVRAYQNLLELDPGNLAALNNLAVIYVEGRDFPRAEDLVRRCLAEHPLVLACRLNLGQAVYSLGRAAEARAIADTTILRFPQNPLARSHLGWLAAAQGDYATADSVFADLADRNPLSPAGVEIARADLDMVRGRVAEARRHLERARQLAAGTEPATVFGAAMRAAWMDLGIRHDTARALAGLDAALREPAFRGLDTLDVPYLALADLFVSAGQLARGEAALEDFLTRVPVEMRRPLDRWLYGVRGYLAMQRGRLQEALEAFRVADTRPGTRLMVLQWLGPFYERAGQPDSAIAAYERYLSTPAFDRMAFDAVLLPGVLERLAVLHEARGDRAEAARYYTRLADLWAGADPELRPRAEAARRHAQALSASRSPDPPAPPAPSAG